MLYVLRQVRKPDRWLGRRFAGAMNLTHSDLTDWGLGHVSIGSRFAILDVGCGGGRTVQKLAALAPAGRVCGVDYAAGSVAVSRGLNAALIEAGRVRIERAAVSKLPFADAEFDLVTAVETHYYWPDLGADMREVGRVVKPGGTVLLVAEIYQGGRHGALERLVMKAPRATLLSVEEHRALLAAAGFGDVQVIEEGKKGWICAIGRKPLEVGAGPARLREIAGA
jgi:SAM-dependent methyltransferase